MSADLSNQTEFDEKLLEAMREAVKVNPASIGNVLIVNFDKYRKVTESGDLLFVLEEEELSKNPFWIEWDPYKPKGSRVKVLFKNGIYWANPKFLRKVKKAEDE